MTDESRDDRQLRRTATVGIWVGLLLIVIATVYIGAFLVSDPRTTPFDESAGARDSVPPAGVDNDESAPSTEPAPAQFESHAAATRIDNVTIRDLDGRIEFRGTVDLAPTLERIERGERLRFAHDGSRFQNRERRLPHKPGGYYHEYVHPTPGVSGPGAQRIIVGRQGEVYYTFDHYRTFRRIK